MNNLHILIVGLGRINKLNNDGGFIRLQQIIRSLSQTPSIYITLYISVRDLQNFSMFHGKNVTIQVLKDVPWFGDSRLLNYIYRTIRGFFYLAFSKERYDVVYCPSDFFHDFLPSLAYKMTHPMCRLFTCMFLIAHHPWKSYESAFLHETQYQDRKSFIQRTGQLFFYLTQRLMMPLIKKYSTQVLVLNGFDKNNLIVRGFPAERITVVSMGINYKDIKNAKPLINSDYAAGYVGRLHPQKGLFLLLLAWRKVVSLQPTLKLFIIGGGSLSEQNQLQETIVRYNLQNNVVYLGFKPNQEIYAYIKATRLLVVPSYYESWGQVVAEGLACEVPVVTFSIPAFKEVFQDKLIYAKMYDDNDLASKILTTLNNNANPTNCDLQKFDWSKVAERELSILANN